MSSHFWHPKYALVACCLLVGSIAGCWQGPFRVSKAVPAGLRDVEAAILRGKISRAWGGDNFEFGQQRQLHFFFMTGIDCPELDQPFGEEARRYLLDNYRSQEIEMEVLRYDDFKREVGHAWVTNDQGERINLAIDLISKGYGWYDGNQFDGADLYRVAMEKAQQNKAGLWSQPNPTPPWEHWQNFEDSLRAE